MTTLLCSKCKNGVMVERSGKYGKFLGCNNYPTCKNTEKIRYKKQPPPKKRDFSDFTPSEYQQAIKDYFVSDNGNVLVNATAGSGKSTTIEYITSFLTGNIRVLAFNKAIATELQSRLPNASVKTLHSMGFELIKVNNPSLRIQVNNSKVFNYLKKSHLDINASKDDKKYFYSIAPHASKLVDMVQSFGVKNPTRDDLAELLLIADIEIKDDILPIVYQWAFDAIRYTREDLSIVSFGDMIDIPYFYEYTSKEKFDYVLVDEAQDLNLAQMEILFNIATVNTKFLFVGDKNQAIYDWRGAASNSMELIADLFDAKNFPLPITYRNSKAIVKHINEKLPYIEHIAHDNAIPGNDPTTIYLSEFYKIVKNSDMVISRTNAQMIKPVWALIKQGIKATIAGKDIGQNLIALILKFKRPSIDDTITELEDHKIEKVNKLNASGKYSAAQMVGDKIDTAINILLEFNNADDAINFIDKTFSDKKEGIVFSTIHKAKGLESSIVFILQTDTELLYSDNNDNGNQELNISFVAMSRPITALYYVINDPIA